MKYVFFISFISILFIGCDNNPTTADNSQNGVIIPLKVGNHWSYIDSSFSDSGNLENVDSSTRSISGFSDISYNGNNFQVFHWTWSINGYSGDFSWLFRNETDGLYLYGTRYSDSNFVNTKSLAFKFPVRINDSWENIQYYSLDTIVYADTSIYTCISINEKVHTASGVFECFVYNYKLRINYDIEDCYVYFAKNIGYVGLLVKRNNVVTFKKVLSSYSLTKKIFERNQIATKSNKYNGTFLKPSFKY